MTTTGYLLGYKMFWDGSQWRFSDDNSPTVTNYKGRACFKCNEPPTVKGHDPCISNLPGVMNACCGHGTTEDAYVMFDNKTTKRGKEAELYFKERSKQS